MAYIYKISNSINDKLYVGQTTESIKRRFGRHRSHSKEEKNSNIVIYRAFNKYGFDNFHIEVLEEVTETLLSEREQFWIKELNTLVPTGYNMLSGGNLMCGANNPFYGRKHTEISKTKMSLNSSNNIGELNAFFNKTHSILSKEKMSISHSKVHNEKKDTIEYKKYKEYMRQINIDNNPFRGKTHTDDNKAMMSLKRRLKNITATSDNGDIHFFDDIELAIDYIITNKLSGAKRSSIRTKIRDGINHKLIIYKHSWTKK